MGRTLTIVAFLALLGTGCRGLPGDEPTPTEETPTPTMTPMPNATQCPNPYTPHMIGTAEQHGEALLVVDGGVIYEGYGYALTMSLDGCISSSIGPLNWLHSARRCGDGILVTETGEDRVVIFNADGDTVWTSDDVELSDGSTLDYPNDAMWTGPRSMLITDRDNDRVVEIDMDGVVAWQYGGLNKPHNGKRLNGGSTLICDSHNDRVIEVNPGGEIVWSYSDGLDWPRNADRLENGNTLITSSANDTILEVTPDGEIVWEVQGIDMPYDADRLPDGTTLISGWGALFWFAPDETLDRCYPEDSEQCNFGDK